MKRELTCILCPRGCALTAEITGNTVVTTGNACQNGANYAQNEILHPVRTVTATVRVANRKDTMVSVKTVQPVAKDSMMTVMEALRSITVNAPVRMGDALPISVGGSKIVITKTIL